MQKPDKTRSKTLGERAERAAIAFLKSHGLNIIETNFACRFGEIDIIASKRKKGIAILPTSSKLLFIEVRFRTHRAYGTAAATVGKQKQQKIIKTAKFYLQNRSTTVQCRFDVIEVYSASQADTLTCHWIKNAFLDTPY